MNILQTIIDLLPYLVSVGSLYIVWRKLHHEVKNIDADTTSKTADKTVKEADAATKWQYLAAHAADQVAALTKRVDALEALTDAQEDRIRCLEIENADLRDWADRLVHQLKARQIEPVEMRKATPKSDTQPLDKV